MALETLTSENWIDIRESIQRRIKELSEAKPMVPARQEQARKLRSLRNSLDKIESLIDILKLDEDQLPFL